MKKLFLFFICIFLISVVSAVSIGISPSKIELFGIQNELVCGNFSILGDANNLFDGEMRWSKIDNPVLSNYTFTSSQLNINSTIPDKVNPGEYRVCFYAKNSGNYFGVLMYKLENSSYGIGIWINLQIKGDSIIEKISLISGNAIKNINALEISFVSFSIALTIILFILIIKLKKKKFHELQ